MILRTRPVALIWCPANASFSTKTYNFPLTHNTVFSETNKSRVQRALKNLPKSYVPREDAAKSRRSAVLVPMCLIHGEPSLLFTLRTRQLSKHRGEVSFPGGMEDKEDGGDPVVTALREAEEELAIPREKVQVWGTLPQLPSRAKGSVTTIPVLAFCDIRLEDLRLSALEVDSVFHRTIASLSDPQNVASTQFRTDRQRFDDGSGKKQKQAKGYSLPLYPPLKDEPYDHKIWGLTAIILHQALKTLLTKDLYQFEVPYVS